MFVASSETGVSRCDRQHPEGFRGGDRKLICPFCVVLTGLF